MKLSYDGETYGTLDLVAVNSVERSELLYKKTQFLNFFRSTWVQLILVVILVLAVVILFKLLVLRKRGATTPEAAAAGGITGPPAIKGIEKGELHPQFSCDCRKSGLSIYRN